VPVWNCPRNVGNFKRGHRSCWPIFKCRVIAQHFDSAERDSENELCQRADAMGYTGGETRETKLAQR